MQNDIINNDNKLEFSALDSEYDAENSLLINLYKVIQSAFFNYNCLSPSQRKKEIDELLSNPLKSHYWHLCIPQTNHNKLEFIEKIESWLELGIENGWIKYANLDKIFSPLHKSFLDQEEFWQRFVLACDTRKNHLTLVLFKLQHQNYKSQLKEIIEQLLFCTDKNDFFGEIKGFGVGLVLPGTGCFAASACAERVLANMKTSLPNHDFEAGITEICEGENADTAFAHAKEALLQNKADNMFVKIYQRAKKDLTNNSLVQADEKRFLFFGI